MKAVAVILDAGCNWKKMKLVDTPGLQVTKNDLTNFHSDQTNSFRENGQRRRIRNGANTKVTNSVGGTQLSRNDCISCYIISSDTLIRHV